MDAFVAFINAIIVVQTFINRDCIALYVLAIFMDDSIHETEVVKWLDSQLPTTQRGKLNGATIFDKLVTIARKRSYTDEIGNTGFLASEILENYKATLAIEQQNRVVA